MDGLTPSVETPSPGATARAAWRQSLAEVSAAWTRSRAARGGAESPGLDPGEDDRRHLEIRQTILAARDPPTLAVAIQAIEGGRRMAQPDLLQAAGDSLPPSAPPHPSPPIHDTIFHPLSLPVGARSVEDNRTAPVETKT